MSGTATSFVLPACSMCSHGKFLSRPVWFHAHRTSDRQGKTFVIWTGCAHAQLMQEPIPLAADSEAIGEVEARWQTETERLFAARTANYTEPMKARFRHWLGERVEMAGATAALEFTPDQPASTATSP